MWDFLFNYLKCVYELSGRVGAWWQHILILIDLYFNDNSLRSCLIYCTRYKVTILPNLYLSKSDYNDYMHSSANRHHIDWQSTSISPGTQHCNWHSSSVPTMPLSLPSIQLETKSCKRASLSKRSANSKPLVVAERSGHFSIFSWTSHHHQQRLSSRKCEVSTFDK